MNFNDFNFDMNLVYQHLEFIRQFVENIDTVLTL